MNEIELSDIEEINKLSIKLANVEYDIGQILYAINKVDSDSVEIFKVLVVSFFIGFSDEFQEKEKRNIYYCKIINFGTKIIDREKTEGEGEAFFSENELFEEKEDALRVAYKLSIIENLHDGS